MKNINHLPSVFIIFSGMMILKLIRRYFREAYHKHELLYQNMLPLKAQRPSSTLEIPLKIIVL